ncbi:hypothetical protein CHY_2412 [Carboxydothermus hydrogenoformans Z-2901]|uniref:Uncharacterized protein n=1 Tax=Carboxydothermus hydrogenoformans (strain ATCC BAA-161 / DSM 6008 / Z-2901) TaxID=246194 RepID=Q3A9H5_CARHZ|nr:hypothetical protein CHY_2412 [Carboxydothermus hydrogenoformans Z-2901]
MRFAVISGNFGEWKRAACVLRQADGFTGEKVIVITGRFPGFLFFGILEVDSCR